MDTDKKKAAGVVQTPRAAYQSKSETERLIMSGGADQRKPVARASMLQAMAQAGQAPFKDLDLVPDGLLHRYRIQGDRSGSLNGWYVLHSEPVPAGAFGSWKLGVTHTWRGDDERQLSAADHAEMRRRLVAMRQAREAERLAVQAEVRSRAEALWRRARPATDEHPYLRRKGVSAIGIRLLRDKLVIPLRDSEGLLHSFQFIPPDGLAKRFLSGGRIAGCYFAIGRPAGRLLVCEGYATGATLWKATRQAVAVAFNAGNLLPVAAALHRKFPDLTIVVCADDDAKTPGNPGLTQAMAAARAVGGLVAAPNFARGNHG